jgi:cell division protein FtsZ
MNTIRRYAADDAHVIFGTAYDESLGDQLRVTVIATGCRRWRGGRAQPPLSVVQPAWRRPALRTGTDNLPILNQPLRQRAGAPPQDYSGLNTPSVWRTARSRRGQGRGAGQQRHGRDRDPGVPAQAGRLRTV